MRKTPPAPRPLLVRFRPLGGGDSRNSEDRRAVHLRRLQPLSKWQNATKTLMRCVKPINTYLATVVAKAW